MSDFLETRVEALRNSRIKADNDSFRMETPGGSRFPLPPQGGAVVVPELLVTPASNRRGMSFHSVSGAPTPSKSSRLGVSGSRLQSRNHSDIQLGPFPPSKPESPVSNLGGEAAFYMPPSDVPSQMGYTSQMGWMANGGEGFQGGVQQDDGYSPRPSVYNGIVPSPVNGVYPIPSAPMLTYEERQMRELEEAEMVRRNLLKKPGLVPALEKVFNGPQGGTPCG